MQLNERTRRWLPWLLLLVAVITTVLAYGPGLAGGWVFDDYPNIVDNAAIHVTRGHADFVAWLNAALSSPSSFLHRPLASLTFAVNWMQGNGNPAPFKATNLVIHLINGVLVYCMLRALLRFMALALGASPRRSASTPFESEGGDSEGGAARDPLPAEGGARLSGATASLPPSEGRAERTRTLAQRDEGDGFPSIDDAAATRLALIVSAAWLLLPINLMAVLYVVQRMESLAQLFVLAGLWAYLHGRWMMLTADGRSREMRGLSLAAAGIVLGTLLGLTAKETAVLLPVFAFLAELVVIRFRRTEFNTPPVLRTDPPPAEGGEPPSAVARSTEPGIQAASSEELDSGFRPAAGPGMTTEEMAAGPGMTNEERAARAGKTTQERTADPAPAYGVELPSRAARSARSETHATAQSTRHSGATRSVEPGIHVEPAEELGSGSPLRDIRNDDQAGATRDTLQSRQTDKRIWALFTITLFVPAVLGFLWLLRRALRPAAFASRDFTMFERLLTEPRVLVDYLHWALLPNPNVLSLYHDEIVKSTGILTPWTTLGSILLLATLVVIAVLARKRHPLVSLGIGWFLGAQLLTATIVPLELVYEQRMYFGSIGVLLAAGSLLLGLRWKIRFPLVRGFLVAVALLWFGTATHLRAQEWSNPLRLAISEANRHPESARAVYEAGRLLLIASNYEPGKLLDESRKYLTETTRIPGSSALSEQALIMIVDHDQHGDDAAYWASMTKKLRTQPTRQEDISALISLTNCYGKGTCKFDLADLQRAYEAALSHPHPIARLYGAYAAFQRDLMHDDVQATKYLALAVQGDPSEPAYRVDLTALYARQGLTEKALLQIDELRRMNLGGRLDGQIATLEKLTEQGKTSQP